MGRLWEFGIQPRMKLAIFVKAVETEALNLKGRGKVDK